MARRGNFKFLSKFSWFVPNVSELLILLVWFVLGALLGNVVTFLFKQGFGSEVAIEYGTLIAYPVMFIPPFIFASMKSQRNSIKVSGRSIDSNNFKPVGAVLCGLMVIVGTVALGYCADAVGSLLPPMPEGLKKLLESMTSGNFWVNLICVSIFAPFFEEWLCRGMVLRGLLGNGVKPVWAIVVSAAFFAMIHLNLWQAIPAFILGCLFGFVYFRTGSLKLTMLMHCVNNTLALVMSQIPSLKEFETWRDMFAGPEYFIILGCCVIFTALVILAFRRIPLEHKSGNMDVVPCIFD